jgi:hypothetical protein
MEAAFARMRNHARNRNLKLVDVAEGVVNGTVSVDDLDPSRGRRSTSR